VSKRASCRAAPGPGQAVPPDAARGEPAGGKGRCVAGGAQAPAVFGSLPRPARWVLRPGPVLGSAAVGGGGAGPRGFGLEFALC